MVSGLVTVVVYVVLLFSSIWWLQKSLRRVRHRSDVAAYPLALQTSLIGFAVVIIFHPRVRYDLYYMLITTIAAWYYIEKAILSEELEQPTVLMEAAAEV